MSDFPASGYLSNAARTEGEMKTAFEDWLAATKQLIGAADPDEMDVPVGGVLVPSGDSAILYLNENGTSTVVGLDNTNLPSNFLLCIRRNPADVSPLTITIHDDGSSAGRIMLAGNSGATDEYFYLVPGEDAALWVYVDGSIYREVGRTQGCAPAQQDANSAILANDLLLVLNTADIRYLDLNSHWERGSSPFGGIAQRSLDFSLYGNHSYFDETGWSLMWPRYRKKIGALWQVLHGGSRYAKIEDADSLSFGDGSNDSPCSFFAWVYVSQHTAAQVIMRKGTANITEREWSLQLKANKRRLVLNFADASVNVLCNCETDADIAVGWHFLCATYDGRGGATAANGITLYVDGMAVASTPTNSGSYVAMENLAQAVGIGADNAGGTNFQREIGLRGVCAVELSSDQVVALMLATRALMRQV